MTLIGVLVNRVRNLWSERPALDWIVAATVIGTHLLYCYTTNGDPFHSSLETDRRKDIYTTVASASALIGGFGTAAISQYATANGRRMLEIRRRFGRSLRKNWSSILTSMLVVTASCIVALIMDTQKRPGNIAWLVEFTLILGASRAVRLVWLFGMLIDVADQDVTEPRRSPPMVVPRPSNADSRHIGPDQGL